MLGYVRADTNELRLREYELYRALYCGLCRRMGRCTGQCSRMTLSYDFVFLAALRISLTGEQIEPMKIRCPIHPLRPRRAVLHSAHLDYCADASALLTYHKLLDDLGDERGFRRLRAALARPFLCGAYRRAARRRPALDAAIREHLHLLAQAEREMTASGSAEALADRFGQLMGEVFEQELTGVTARIAAALGCAVGHWIYLADAADDFEQDLRRGRFNPYRSLFGETPSDLDWENVSLAMTAQLCRAEQAFLLIDAYPNPALREILANILYLGLPATARRLTCRKSDRESAPVTTDSNGKVSIDHE